MAIPISGNVFSNIPTPIFDNILARLTPEDVGRCRCVCKTWLKLLSEAEFVNLHLSKSQTCLIGHNDPSDFPDSAAFCVLQVEDDTNYHGGVRYKVKMNMEIPLSHATTTIGSINGLVCIYELSNFSTEYDAIHVWNPIIGELITIQMPNSEEDRKYPDVVTYGFGISSGKYHVVRIFQKIQITDSETNIQKILDSTCHVYTLGTGFWKNIGHAPYYYSCREFGLFFNGNLHWTVYDENGPEHICCLDLESESFKPFPPPPEFPERHLVTLNVYKGCISACDNTSDYDIVIWVMKEYGVQNSWTKEVVINKQLIDRVGNYYTMVHIIKVYEDGEILLLCMDDKFFSYNPNKKTVQDFDVQDFYPWIGTEYVPSIVSLKNLGEKVNVNSAKRAATSRVKTRGRGGHNSRGRGGRSAGQQHPQL